MADFDGPTKRKSFYCLIKRCNFTSAEISLNQLFYNQTILNILLCSLIRRYLDVAMYVTDISFMAGSIKKSHFLNPHIFPITDVNILKASNERSIVTLR